MSTFIFANNVQTQLAAPITSAGQTTIVLASSANIPSIPAGAFWPITLNDALSGNVYEIVWATGAVGATLTVLRGQEGTAANTWIVGDNAYSTDTAATMNNFVVLSPLSQQSGAINVSGGITAGGQLTVAGSTAGSYTITPGGTAAANSVYIGNDGGAVNGMLINIPLASTNGFRWTTNGGGGAVIMQLHTAGDLQIQPTINGTQTPGNVPPVYNNGGGNLGITSHIVVGSITAAGASTTITFAANAVFNSGSFVAFVYDQNGGAPVAVTNLGGGTSFSFPSTAGHAYGYFAIGT